jgi:hypothetical protein
MFLHELSRRVAEDWRFRVESEEYGKIVRERFGNECPYCSRTLADGESIIEHLDGMNRFRTGLHVVGNVLVACKKCNGEKRRDDSAETLSLAETGWASFLSHDGTRCVSSCRTCEYWCGVWRDEAERKLRLRENAERIRLFRASFPEFERVLPALRQELPKRLTKLYADCQAFAKNEIRSMLEGLDQ